METPVPIDNLDTNSPFFNEDVSNLWLASLVSSVSSAHDIYFTRDVSFGCVFNKSFKQSLDSFQCNDAAARHLWGTEAIFGLTAALWGKLGNHSWRGRAILPALTWFRQRWHCIIPAEHLNSQPPKNQAQPFHGSHEEQMRLQSKHINETGALLR